MIYGAIVGGMTGIIMTLIIQQLAKSKISQRQVTLEQLSSVDSASYEVYYIGIEKDYKKLSLDNINFLNYSDMLKLKNAESITELPFDSSKRLVVIFPHGMAIKQFEKITTKFNIDYRTLGDFRMVMKQQTK